MEFLEWIQSVLQSIGNSWWFHAFKIFMAVYVTVLIADIILVLYLHDSVADVRKQFRGANVTVLKKKDRKQWGQVRARLSRGTVSQYKLAILEADYMLDKGLSHVGYRGANLTEKLENVDAIQFSNIEDIRAAHQLRNAIVHDEHYVIEREQAEKVLDDVEAFLKNIGVLV